MMQHERTIRLSAGLLEWACQDSRNLDALTLAVIIKANFVNSTFHDYSIRKVMGIAHCNYKRASESLERAIDSGLLSVVEDKSGNRHIQARRLSGKEDRLQYKIRIVESGAGKQIYLQSKEQDNKTKFSESDKQQSFKVVRDILLACKLFYHIKSWKHSYDKVKNSDAAFSLHNKTLGKKEALMKRESLPDRHKRYTCRKETLTAHGLSYLTMGTHFEALHLSVYQITGIINLLKTFNVIQSRTHSRAWVYTDFEADPVTPKDFLGYDPYSNAVRNYLGSCFNGKGNDQGTWYRHSSNLYTVTGDIVYSVGFSKRQK